MGGGQGEAGVQTLCHLMPTSCQPRANLMPTLGSRVGSRGRDRGGSRGKQGEGWG